MCMPTLSVPQTNKYCSRGKGGVYVATMTICREKWFFASFWCNKDFLESIVASNLCHAQHVRSKKGCTHYVHKGGHV